MLMAHSKAIDSRYQEGTNNIGSSDVKHWSLGDAREKISKVTSMYWMIAVLLE
jgi:predicted component of type VI protein secretion system